MRSIVWRMEKQGGHVPIVTEKHEARGFVIRALHRLNGKAKILHMMRKMSRSRPAGWKKSKETELRRAVAFGSYARVDHVAARPGQVEVSVGAQANITNRMRIRFAADSHFESEFARCTSPHHKFVIQNEKTSYEVYVGRNSFSGSSIQHPIAYVCWPNVGPTVGQRPLFHLVMSCYFPKMFAVCFWRLRVTKNIISPPGLDGRASTHY